MGIENLWFGVGYGIPEVYTPQIDAQCDVFKVFVMYKVFLVREGGANSSIHKSIGIIKVKLIFSDLKIRVITVFRPKSAYHECENI